MIHTGGPVFARPELSHGRVIQGLEGLEGLLLIRKVEKVE